MSDTKYEIAGIISTVRFGWNGNWGDVGIQMSVSLVNGKMVDCFLDYEKSKELIVASGLANVNDLKGKPLIMWGDDWSATYLRYWKV